MGFVVIFEITSGKVVDVGTVGIDVFLELFEVFGTVVGFCLVFAWGFVYRAFGFVCRVDVFLAFYIVLKEFLLF